MKVDVKDNNNFEVEIKRSLTDNQRVLTIKTADKTIDITFEDYHELKKVHDVIGHELMTAYVSKSVTIGAVNGDNNDRTDKFGDNNRCLSSDIYLSPDDRKNGFAVGISPNVTEINANAINAHPIANSHDVYWNLTSSYTNTSGKGYSDTKPL